ncbi:MAG TPA: type II toxin-antitoxin system antitoxin SocA domain-containing protein [Candidatus Paceibacterota bacterium]
MLAKFIQEQRKKRNLTQEFLASALKISRPTYMQIERGERDLTITEARKLAKTFEISLNDLLSLGDTITMPKIVLEKEKKEVRPDMEIRVTRKNLGKFKQVLLYVLEKVGAKPNIGETVLYKLLYFIDFDYYEKFEENLMGATYIKNHHGPTPVEFKDIVEQMKKDGDLEEVKSKYFTYAQKKYLPHKRPDLSALSGQEIEHIDEVLARLSDKNAKELSDYSHGDIPWLSREFGERISYESVFYRDDKYSVRSYDDEL